MFYKMIVSILFLLSTNLWGNVLENLKSFEADFTQTIHNSSGQQIVYKGHLYIKEPSKILWQYKDPIIKNVYVINQVAIIDEPELEQAVIAKLENELDFIKILKSAKRYNKMIYRATIQGVVYELILRDSKIKYIKYQDELQNMVTLSFDSVKQNEPIKDELFNFNPPEYYDIIRK